MASLAHVMAHGQAHDRPQPHTSDASLEVLLPQRGTLRVGFLANLLDNIVLLARRLGLRHGLTVEAAPSCIGSLAILDAILVQPLRVILGPLGASRAKPNRLQHLPPHQKLVVVI